VLLCRFGSGAIDWWNGSLASEIDHVKQTDDLVTINDSTPLRSRDLTNQCTAHTAVYKYCIIIHSTVSACMSESESLLVCVGALPDNTH
jgi:hypothetical protein